MSLFGSGQRGGPDIRPAVVAGRFYPGSASALRKAIEAFMADAAPVQVRAPLAIVAPHAGYIFSGQVAADGFRQAADHSYDVVVILGTNHTSGSFRKISLYPGDGFSTPLGTVAIAKEVVTALMAADPECILDRSLHEQEHSIEVQLPFVQVLFPDVPIVPAVVGAPDVGLCTRFGKALADVLKTRHPLIVASADLSHYPTAEDAEVVDRKTLDAMEKMDPALLQQVTQAQMRLGIQNLHTCACGEAAVMAAMSAAKAMGAAHGKVIRYAHSGYVPEGGRDRVVGYGAVVYHDDPLSIPEKEAPSRIEAGETLTDGDKKALLEHVRETLRNRLSHKKVPRLPTSVSALKQKMGIFVTLKKRGALRGCIGRMIPDMPLHELAGVVALQSAFDDPRFRPVTPDELDDLEIEISLLTPMSPVPDAGHIVVGRDGVLIRKQGRSAVFLPQVAPEQGWGREEMLDHLCLKAGLPEGSWEEGAELLTFQAVVFSEADFERTPLQPR